MAMRGGPRLQVGSAAWVAEEREAALSIACSEVDEFSYAARNELDWLNEHMADIFSENQMNVAEIFKSPSKFRGKTPRTVRREPSSARVPLASVFSSTPKGAPNPLAMSTISLPRSPAIQVAEDAPSSDSPIPSSPTGRSMSPTKATVVHPMHEVKPRGHGSLADSGYHGSQSQLTQFEREEPLEEEDIEMSDSGEQGETLSDPVFSPENKPTSPSATSVHETYQSPVETRSPQRQQREESAVPTPSSALQQPNSPFASRTRLPIMSPRAQPSPKKTSSPIGQSPGRRSPSPQKSRLASPPKASAKLEPAPQTEEKPEDGADQNISADEEEEDDISEASSPVLRPVMRKSSLNFASLPAREPLTSKKSLGGAAARMSRTSFTRQSYYPPAAASRLTGGGKSLGVGRHEDDDMEGVEKDEDKEEEEVFADSKTYTQRLHEQISMLGKSQAQKSARPSKSLASFLPAAAGQQQQGSAGSMQAGRQASPKPKQQPATTPGPVAANEDDFVRGMGSPRPLPPRPQTSGTTECRDTGDMSPASSLPRSRPTSPSKNVFSPTHRTPNSHSKSQSVPVLPSLEQLRTGNPEDGPKKTIAQNPTLSTAAGDGLVAGSPAPRSPRSFRDNPLKQVKNKLSSFIKSSKGLIGSSGSATLGESKTSSGLVQHTPSVSRAQQQKVEKEREKERAGDESVESYKTADNVAYPDLSRQVEGINPTSAKEQPQSPVQNVRRTRASAERERLEKERAESERQEREKMRVVEKERERVAQMERHITAQQEKEKQEKERREREQDFRTPGPRPKSVAKPAPSTIQTTPHKNAAADEDLDMTEAPATIAPPSVARPTTASSMRIPAAKRPLKPTKEALNRSTAKQAPTVIKVNTSSAAQVSNSVLAATLGETLAPPTNQTTQAQAAQGATAVKGLSGKGSAGSLRDKPSLQSLKNSMASSSQQKQKAADAAAAAAQRKKEQEEREAQKRELQRKREQRERERAAQQEEERRRREEMEQQRRLEEEQRKKEEERKRKAAIEKAKMTKAPPPPVRTQPNGPPDYSATVERERQTQQPARPPSRLGSIAEGGGRLVNTVLSSTAAGKGAKRPLQEEKKYQAAGVDAKRMRMSEEFDENVDMAEGGGGGSSRMIKGAPIRPSTGFKKEIQPPKQHTYSSNAHGHTYSSKDLFKTTVISQHNNQNAGRPAHPLDMAQVAKGPIPFANNNTQAASSHKTPARAPGTNSTVPSSAAKSAARSSPRFPNGELIELPDIATDDDDDYSDADNSGSGAGQMLPSWADSPELRRQLLEQERIDPTTVFGVPQPLNMEEVFNKSKDRWHRFRQRTSSANWSGADRLTEEEMRRDAIARDRMRREGGWTWELGKEMY